MLFDVCGDPRLKSKGNDSAVTVFLRSYVGKPTTTKGLGVRNLRGWNLDVETIAASIDFIVIQRLIRPERHARSLRRIAGMQSSDMLAISWSARLCLGRRIVNPTVGRNHRGAKQKNGAPSQN